jgi:hypothetical protein
MIVSLPIVSAETTLDDALDLLRQAERGAVLVPMGGKYRLIDAADIVRGCNAGVDTIQRLAWHKVAPIELPPADMPGILPDALRRMAFGFKIKLADVEISDEDLVARIANEVRLYYCNGPRKHPFWPGDVTVGQDCPENDGGVIEA